MDTQQETTPVEQQEDLSAWQRAEFAIEHSNRVLLYGLPGTGKTYFGLTHATNGKQSYRLACTEEMTEADLIGFWRREASGNLKWQEGVGIKAWREGARLVVDEVNRINGDVESKLMTLGHRGKRLLAEPRHQRSCQTSLWLHRCRNHERHARGPCASNP